MENVKNKKNLKKAISTETFVFIGISLAILIYLANKMGIGIMFSVMMKTAHDLVLNTTLYIMAVAVLAGGAAGLMSEFGVIALINKIISPIMRPLFGLPGAASLGAVTTYLSDNPAILSLIRDKEFIKYFTKAESVALINLANTFGMGLIVTSYCLGLGDEYIPAIIIGNIAAILGGIFSIRAILHIAKKEYKEYEKNVKPANSDAFEYRKVREGSVGQRVLDSLLEGGKNGVELGLSIIPGVVIVCTIVMILTFGPSDVVNGVPVYEGVAGEGIGLLPKLGEKISFILDPMFGFKSTEALALPITSLGAVGAAMGMAKGLLEKGLMNAHDIAVFSAMGICWAGFLSVQVGQMDAIGARKLIGKSMLVHFIGGLIAGILANYMYIIFC
ncbi:CD0519/CD1768 family membrane protein [Anaerosalibacter bizertensis]|uniref:CD0519/CD1768 family membrane protein n=1 Tax=Anaerosalibacter bizertensis TaxID=932217 RepID=UPI003511BB4F